MIRTFAARVAAVTLFIVCGVAHAAPRAFNFEFREPAGTARAVGQIVFEDSALANPGNNQLGLPNPAVVSLTVTVTGSEFGNGTFGIQDFTTVAFDTNGGSLNLGAPLIGQATTGLPWGTVPSAGAAGDFNLFSGTKTRDQQYAQRTTNPSGVVDQPPNGFFYFTLAANGGDGEQMELFSFAPGSAGGPAVAIPVFGNGSTFGLAALFAAAGLALLGRRALR